MVPRAQQSNPSLLGGFFQMFGGRENVKWDLYTVVIFINWLANFVLIAAGAVAVIYLILGGYSYMTSMGNPEAATKGKSMILWSIAGLLLILGAWVIINFVLKALNVPETVTTPSNYNP